MMCQNWDDIRGSNSYNRDSKGFCPRFPKDCQDWLSDYLQHLAFCGTSMPTFRSALGMEWTAFLKNHHISQRRLYLQCSFIRTLSLQISYQLSYHSGLSSLPANVARNWHRQKHLVLQLQRWRTKEQLQSCTVIACDALGRFHWGGMALSCGTCWTPD